MKSESWGCGCWLKVYVCPEHLEVAREELRVAVVAQSLQYELREGREAGEAGDPW